LRSIEGYLGYTRVKSARRLCFSRAQSLSHSIQPTDSYCMAVLALHRGLSGVHSHQVRPSALFFQGSITISFHSTNR